MASRPTRVDLVVAFLLTGLGVAEAGLGLTGEASAWYLVLSVPVVTLPVLVRRTRPAAALGTVLAGLLAQAALGSDLGGGFSEAIALVLVLYSVGAQLSLPRASALLASALVAVGAVVGLGPDPRAGNFVFALTEVSVAWLAGRGVRLAEERTRLLGERRVAQERTRVAAELHDVVSHHLSAVVILAGARRREVPADSDESRGLAEIENRGREALHELRRLLGLLRIDPTDTAPRAPQPGLGDLTALVASARDTGVPARLTTSGSPRAIGEGLALTVYRVVQEALTNAGKHAHGGEVEVLLDWGPQRLGVEVVSRGGTGSRHVPGGGFGLRTMAERVHTYGGELTAQPVDGGFRVRADLPIGRLRP